MIARALCIAGLFAALTGAVIKAQPRRVTVATVAGDVVEGTLKIVSETEVVVEVADQTVTLPVASIKYLSFVGRLSDAATVPTLDAAVRALKDLRGVVEIGGITRPQYAQKLGETIPRILEFAREPNATDWIDVRIAMQRAAESYQQPLASDAAWQGAVEPLRRAVAFGEFAVTNAVPGEAAHVESQDARALKDGDSVTGRLGHGDRTLPEALDKAAADGFHDIFTFEVAAAMRVEIQLSCAPCVAHLAIADADGKRVDGALGAAGSARIRHSLDPGTYTIWAGTTSGQVGTYSLELHHRQER